MSSRNAYGSFRKRIASPGLNSNNNNNNKFSGVTKSKKSKNLIRSTTGNRTRSRQNNNNNNPSKYKKKRTHRPLSTRNSSTNSSTNSELNTIMSSVHRRVNIINPGNSNNNELSAITNRMKDMTVKVMPSSQSANQVLIKPISIKRSTRPSSI